MGKKSKSSSNKKKSKDTAINDIKNLNIETVESLTRLDATLASLDPISNANVVGQSTNANDQDARTYIHDDSNNDNGIGDATVEQIDEGVKIAAGLPLSHWKQIPDEIQQAYKLLNEGAELVKATSTKYTLIGKISVDDGSKRCNDLRQGCEIIATGTLLIHQPSSGCARPTRHFAKQLSRAIVISVRSLIESFATKEALSPGSNIGAQRTGAVWNSCDALLTRLPKGNRICMRREIFTWVSDCNETMEEFQELLDLDRKEQLKSDEDDGEECNDDEQGWDSFCEDIGTGDRYSTLEKPIVASCLAIIKCSRGVLNLTMKACEAAGDKSSSLHDETVQQSVWQWISSLHEIARVIGDNVTELGSLLYPPLNVAMVKDADCKIGWEETAIGRQVLIQKKVLMKGIDHILDTSLLQDHSLEVILPEEVLEMAKKLLAAVKVRSGEAETSLSRVVCHA